MASKRTRDEGDGTSGEKKVKVDTPKSEGGTTSTTDDVMEIRVLISNYEAGVVIGKGGSNVKSIREKSGAFISILKSEGESKERVMQVKGSTENSAQAVYHIILLLLEDKQKKEQQETEQQSGSQTETKSENFTLKTLVHKFSAGCIIGKAGAIVKQISLDTGVRLQVSNEPLPGSVEKSVSITGTPTAIHQALLRVLAQVKDNPVRGGNNGPLFVPGRSIFSSLAPVATASPFFPTPYAQGEVDPSLAAFGLAPPFGSPYPPTPTVETTQKIAIPTVCAGAVIGKGGGIIADIKAQSGCQVRIADPEQSSPNERVVTIIGSPQGIQTAVYMIRQRVEQPYSSFGSSSYSDSSSGSGSETSQKIAIPTVCAGAVIGKGGTIIADIKQQSGCQIRISDPEPSSPNERVVTVSGSPAGIQTAVFLIRQRVEQPYSQYGEQPAMD